MPRTNICLRCRVEVATVWIVYQGRKAKVCKFCEIAVGLDGW